MERTILKLIRTHRQGKAVTGTLDIQLGLDILRCHTLENADFLIPAGKYPLRITYSPRFQKHMPEICDVPEREGIRIHTGSIPEHSTGCVLLTPFGRANLESFIHNFNKHHDDELSIVITTKMEKPL